MRQLSRPPQDENSRFKRITLSIPKEVFKRGERTAKRKGFENSFSAYVSFLLGADK